MRFDIVHCISFCINRNFLILPVWCWCHVYLTAGLRCGDHEQHTLLGRVPSPRLRAGFDVGFLFGGPRHLPCLHHNGPLHQLPDQFPALDMFRGLSAVSAVAHHRLRPWLQVRLVVDLGSFKCQVINTYRCNVHCRTYTMGKATRTHLVFLAYYWCTAYRTAANLGLNRIMDEH